MEGGKNLAHLLPPSWKATVTSWLDEDIPSFDYGGYVVGDKLDTAFLYGKSKGVLAGVPFFDEVFAQVGCSVEWRLREGDAVEPANVADGRVVVAVVKGPARQLLIGERTALNMLARASGIATLCRRLADLKAAHKYHGVIAGTRKTTPGFRLVEKYAMLVGGIDTHRMDLSSMIMLKDNHIWSQGSITGAVKQARAVGGFSVKIEVEARSKEEAIEAIAAGSDIVMLDNFTPDELKRVAGELKREFPAVLLEGSGGITEHSIANYFCPGIDVLSLGSVTQGVSFVDFSLKVQHA